MHSILKQGGISNSIRRKMADIFKNYLGKDDKIRHRHQKKW